MLNLTTRPPHPHFDRGLIERATGPAPAGMLLLKSSEGRWCVLNPEIPAFDPQAPGAAQPPGRRARPDHQPGLTHPVLGRPFRSRSGYKVGHWKLTGA